MTWGGCVGHAENQRAFIIRQRAADARQTGRLSSALLQVRVEIEPARATFYNARAAPHSRTSGRAERVGPRAIRG
ncbi:hypothetical protein WS67_18395 [Burkholderia singularis]|uniref:Uncharacterized protein n=1 Tax=Burkholderia singularis TaxID=1503053 RepID=A0A103DYV5_9BURK|nr:hypothetical protein AQ611_06505 [Burkholderia sp. Bp7605]KVE25245.1 hypothetical protein WS67_18395 [Burkholderia singularis]